MDSAEQGIGGRMSQLLAFIWDKIPRPVRWIIITAVLLFYTPIKLRDELYRTIDARVYAVVTPYRQAKAIELKHLHKQMDRQEKAIDRANEKLDQLLMRGK